MLAKSIKGKSSEEIKTALEKNMADGFKPTLAICFISISQDRNAIRNILDAADISIFGCTTNGEFVDEEKIMIKGVATCGWRAVGTIRTVTKSTGNHIYTIDDIPVLDITTKYGGLENLKETQMPEADALVVFSCAGRILSLGPLMVQEIEGIKSVWNVPMIGMFSNAELARATGGNLEMHNLTTCCVALKEK